MSANDLFSEHADAIESVLAYICRANRLAADAGDEFCSFARLRLLEDDGAILRKYRGLSTLRTFLVTVLQRLFLDWRIGEWGKWRPTAEARRHGPVAIELEKLVLRDRMEFEQAVTLLVSKGLALSREECDRVWAELPRRPARRRAGDEVLEVVAGSPPPDPIGAEDDAKNATRASSALAEALPALTSREQLLVRLRYQDGFTVARIAQLLGEEQKPLYRQFDQALARMRTMLVAAGVTADEVRDLLGNPSVELGAVFPAGDAGKTEPGPSTTVNAKGGA